MDAKARLRRLTYLAHRWLGVGGCLLMLVWFLSGIVMLYVGYPKLTPEERFASLPVLAADAYLPLDAAQPGGALAVLTSVRGEPTYIIPTPDGPRAWSARTGRPDGVVTADMAVAAARAFWPSGTARHAGLIDEDRWTHSRGLDGHRPLHKVRMEGDAAGTLYVSSATGEVVLDAPIVQQRWNYVGAWLHWLYMARDRSVDPVWSWMVIALSAVCTVLAISGTVVGVWRWRFRGRYKTGARTPYREAWMRWHHIIGLAFSAFVCTWIFSGLMSMNPGGLFAAADPGPDRQAMAGAQLATPIADPQPVLQALHAAGFEPVQLEWRRMSGQPYVVARNATAGSRIVHRVDGAMTVQTSWQPEAVLDAARALFPGAAVRATLLDHYDAYYYARHAEAMNGGAPRGLPVLRLDFDTPAGDHVYVDLRTGEVALSLSRAQRVGRWLFYFLHSWDTPALLNAGVGRDLALILLSLGGLAVSATGIVLGTRRLGWSRGTPVESRHPQSQGTR
ncbi:PepSY-associated TM helix domain-containing protein [Achromobacter insolitus]|uniref:PepSY-associated TM helix domain-containing protein n=1 Tax=Achromobacter insolitus TaxID=217204 RepID=UPI001748791A|nr:PepSY-associated TM helix domain-containing protein [Achromobacter insolitus]